MNQSGNRRALLIAAIIATMLLPSVVKADSLVINLTTLYNGTLPPGTTSPILTATFQQVDSHNVTLTMSAVGLGPYATFGNYVGMWAFNFNPALSASNLSFSSGTVLT